MKIYSILLAAAFLIFNSQTLSAQKSKQRFGIQTGNLWAVPTSSESDVFKTGGILRYSIGFFFRKKVNPKFRLDKIFLASTRHGVLEFDYGLTFVFKGYEYQFNSLGNTNEQLAVEVPLLMVIYDNANVFIPRKWRRKGLTTYGRMGIKPSYLINSPNIQEISQANERLTEIHESDRFNVFAQLGFGLIQNNKTGTTSSIEIGANIGFLANSKSELTYRNNSTGSVQEDVITSNGTYFDIKVLYVVAPPKEKSGGTPPPVIYNPRF